MNIGNRIRELRLARGMRINDLADAVGVDQANISRLETGKQKSFTEQSLNKIADALNVSLSELFIPSDPKNTVYNDSKDIVKGIQGGDVYRVDLLDLNVSAGPGAFVGSDIIDVIRSIEYNAEHAKNFFGGKPEAAVKMVNVRGDSMSGTIEPGDLVFVDVSVTQFDGDGIYVFGFDGKIHIKRLQIVPDKIVVISDNTRYRDWFIDESNEQRFRIFGKVMISQSQSFKRHG